eukprot:g2319.t1
MASALPGKLSDIVCCICAAKIQPNASAMCMNCLSSSVDITKDVPKQCDVLQCRKCFSYYNSSTERWVALELESAGLLALCLKRLPQLRKDLKLVDASWVWTEPHSKRLKVKLVVRKELADHNNVVLQKAFLVEYVVHWRQCSKCNKSFTGREWEAVVQVRQHGVAHKRSFLHLEQMILRRGAHAECMNVTPQRDGVDFYFVQRSHGARFAQFVQSVMAVRSKLSKKLVSESKWSKHANMKFSWSIELPSLCKDDLVHLPRALAQQLGFAGRLVLVERVGAQMHLIEPANGRRGRLHAEAYWRYHDKGVLRALASKSQARPFVVLDLELEVDGHRGGGGAHAKRAGALVAGVEVARESDFGENDTTFHMTTHLGRVLDAGDTALGYDVASLASGVDDADEIAAEVVLLRKLRSVEAAGGGGAAPPAPPAQVLESIGVLGDLDGTAGAGGKRAAADSADFLAAQIDAFSSELADEVDDAAALGLSRSEAAEQLDDGLPSMDGDSGADGGAGVAAAAALGAGVDGDDDDDDDAAAAAAVSAPVPDGLEAEKERELLAAE